MAMKVVGKKLGMSRFVVLLLAGTFAVTSALADSPIRLKRRTIVPDTVECGQRTVKKASGAQNPDVSAYIIQAPDRITSKWSAIVVRTGARILRYLPENAYLIEVDTSALAAIKSNVQWSYLGEYVPEYRLSQNVANFANGKDATIASTASTKAVSTRDSLQICSVCLFSGASLSNVADRVRSMPGCRVLAADGSVVRCALTADGVFGLASLPEVEWIEEWHQPKTKNKDSVKDIMMNVETVWPGGDAGLGLTGKGQVVAVADSGLSTGDKATLHRDVRGRVTRTYAHGQIEKRKNYYYDYESRTDWKDFSGHGTHVTGSILGNGTMSSSPKIRGVAYEASLIFQSCGIVSSGKSGEIVGTDDISTPSDLNDLFLEAYKDTSEGKGARIHSNSWGDTIDDYSSDAKGIDEFIFNHPDMLILFVAGNEGVDRNRDGVVDLGNLGSQANAKNVLAVGASERWENTFSIQKSDSAFPVYPLKDDPFTWGTTGQGVQGIARFSSRGPCGDGRTKPDLVAPGTYVLSMRAEGVEDDYYSRTYGSDKLYGYLSGTSMATPLVAGSAALVRQWLVEKRDIANPDGATIKALLMAGARSLYPGQFGTGAYKEIPDGYPNNVEGWGQVDLGRTIQNTNGILVYDAQVIAQGESRTFKIKATAGNPLTAIMVYADAPPAMASAKQLVNDLDLLVRTPSGVELHPNSLSEPDRLNNAEGIRIPGEDVESGAYTITVTGYAINMPMSTGLTGGRENACRYSLVVNGAVEASDPPAPPVTKVMLGKNGGTGGDNYVIATLGQPMPTPCIAPKKAGWTFAGYWDTVKAGGKQYYDANMNSVRNWDRSGEVTLWAKWTNKVTLGKNGGSGGDDYVTCTEGQPMPAPRTAPKRSGWTFAGYWDTLAQDANGNPTGKQYYDANMNSVRPWDKPGTITLWAKWTVRVTLGKNGGSGGDDYVTVTFNQPFPKRTMPKKSGHTFGGYWVSSSSRTGQCYNADGTGAASMKWTTGGSPIIWALWAAVNSGKKTAAFVDAWDGGDPQLSSDVEGIWVAGLYKGPLVGGEGTFSMLLDDGLNTAYLIVWAAEDCVTHECEAEVSDYGIVLVTEDGEMYLIGRDDDGIVATRIAQPWETADRYLPVAGASGIIAP